MRTPAASFHSRVASCCGLCGQPTEESSVPKLFRSHPVFTILERVKRSNLRLQERQIIAGRYEILSLLGAGGNGEVWHAYDVKLRVDVALKSLRLWIRPVMGMSLTSLRREVRNAREVLSPNVCRIFDLVAEENQELISMEYHRWNDAPTHVAAKRNNGNTGSQGHCRAISGRP